MNKLYLYGIIMIAVVAALYFYGESKYQAGIAYCENQQREAQLEQLRKDSETILELEKEDGKSDKVTAKVKDTVRNIPDTSGCSDVPEPEHITNCMREFFNSGASPRLSKECTQGTTPRREGDSQGL